MTDFQIKTAIVSGAARGIGRAIAVALAEKGLSVALVDLREPDLAATAELVRGHGAEALTIGADIADHQAAKDHVAAVLARWGRIDVLVNNAAILQSKRILEITESEWDRGMAVNLKGYFNWCQAVAPAMIAQGHGRIINMSSVSAHTGPSPQAASRFAYSATKAGVLGLTRGLARELSPQVCVNAICPGAILTERTVDSFTPHLERMQATTPLGRVGTPEDIAVVAAFLATATPMFMTGEVIDVDGGANIN